MLLLSMPAARIMWAGGAAPSYCSRQGGRDQEAWGSADVACRRVLMPCRPFWAGYHLGAACLLHSGRSAGTTALRTHAAG